MSGRVAFVTGASRGIGRATALRLAADHAAVVVHYRTQHAAAAEVAGLLAGQGAEGLAVGADLADAGAVDACFDQVAERFGHLDTLVANAAATSFRPTLTYSRLHLQRTLETTVVSFVHLCARAVALMGRGGRIVAVSGLDSHYAVPAHGAMGAGKAGLEALTRSLAVDLGPAGITVNAVVPGAIDTDSAAQYFAADPAGRAAVVAAIPAGRFGAPADVAEVIAFLCSPTAAYVNGTTIVVDGGLSAGGGPWAAMAGAAPKTREPDA